MFTFSPSTWRSAASRYVRRHREGRVWMPPVLQGDFLTFWRLGAISLVCQACSCGSKLPLAAMQFEERGPHRFRELCRSSPGTGFHVLNIEVLAA
jgi:hypothetical protein